MNISVVSSAGTFCIKLLWNSYTSVCGDECCHFYYYCHERVVSCVKDTYCSCAVSLPASSLLPFYLFLSSTKRAPLVFLFPGGNTRSGSASPSWRHLLFSLFHLWWTFSLKLQSVLWRHAWACKSSRLALGQTLFWNSFSQGEQHWGFVELALFNKPTLLNFLLWNPVTLSFIVIITVDNYIQFICGLLINACVFH